MVDIIPKACDCRNLGTCRYCKMLAWSMKHGIVHVQPPRSAAQQGSYASMGRTNSPSAKRKARLTRIKTEREKFQAAMLASRERSASGDDRATAVLAMLEAAHKVAPMQDTLLRRLSTYLRRSPEVQLLVLDAPDADTGEADYRDKIARPAYLTRSSPWTGRDD